jgi:hypothetical protein
LFSDSGNWPPKVKKIWLPLVSLSSRLKTSMTRYEYSHHFCLVLVPSFNETVVLKASARSEDSKNEGNYYFCLFLRGQSLFSS